MNLREQLRRDEAVRRKPYRDNSKEIGFEGVPGKVTIGVGRNLDDVGLSDAEIDLLLDNDIARAQAHLLARIPWITSLNEARVGVLENMTFNMGIDRLLPFVRTLELIRIGDYAGGAAAMLNSRWATQVGDRAKRLSEQMKTGEWK